MPLSFSVASPSTGELFTSTFDAFHVQGMVPMTPLPPSHPFLALWKEHLTELTSSQAGPYGAVIDAFVSLAEGSPTWREEEGMTENKIAAKMSGMRDLLSQHPPNIVVVSGVAEYVKLWVDANKPSDESAQNRCSEKLVLTAFLKTSIDHEIGHWIFTLKVGYYSGVKNTLKVQSATWGAKEEAGNFVEVHSCGGILTYSKGEKKALLHTGSKPTAIHILPISYLWVYGNNHSIRGASSQLWFTPSEKNCLGKNKIASDIFFPRGADDELLQPSSECEPFVSYYELKSRGHADAEEILECWKLESDDYSEP